MNIFKDKVSRALGSILAKRVKKEEFLSQLKEAWTPEISSGIKAEEIVKEARKRMKASGQEHLFKNAKITDEDLIRVVKEIQAEKVTTYHREDKVGRNEPCPCGSGKKYKRCCSQ